MLKFLRRWRHSRGFGVHSPFAFRFIREVLREHRCAYYAYADIAGEVRRRPGVMALAEALLLYRVAVDLRPVSACVAAGGARGALAAEILSKAGVPIVDGDAEFYYGDALPPVQPPYTFLVGQKAVPPLRGQIFVNRHGTVIAVSRRSYPTQIYDILF